jgi:hypothetical protein
VDLKSHASVGPAIKSVLIDATGEILKESELRIGKLSAFYTKKGEELEDATEYKNASSITSLFDHKYDILDPVAGVLIEGITGYIDGLTASDSSGFYNLTAFPTPCPGFDYFPELTAMARLYYSNFNPKGSPSIPYYLEKTSYNYCNGIYLKLANSGNIAGLMAANTILGIVSAAPENITRLNYPVAINVLAGNALIAGAAISDTEPTEYFAEESPMTDTIVYNDYDGDGFIDDAQRGDYNEEGVFVVNADADKYGVYLTGSPREDNQPNFTRVIDTLKDVKHKGLVKVINKTELMETDILVFRESTGQLITERSGLSETDLKHSKILGRLQQDDDGNFSYTIAIRSTEDTAASKRKWFNLKWQDWQAASQMNPELHGHKSDYIRNGEQLRIVAINRATGYIGTQIQELTGPRDGGDVTVPVKPIIMKPPNLKVWATRSYQPSGALSGADKRRNTISNEGAASTDDYVIEIHSNWLDENGFPLPAGLKDRGYTGRLVKVSIDPATTNDPYDTQITEFPINPGKALQVLKFGEGEVGKYHYYLQVNGKTGAESNDFSTGNHVGVLRHRPNKYVPVKVPLFDETITNVNKILRLQNNPDAKGTNAAFDWVYRPELSFSVVDLEVSSILLHSNDPEDDPLELINSTDPVISTADSAVEIFYNLLSSQFDRITPLDGEQTFILAFGEEEIEITVNSDGTPIKFTNLEHLAEIKPEDYMSIRLYLNEDSQNVLWDWAFSVDGINLITSSDEGSRDKNSFIMCEVAQANSNTCELQNSIKAQLVASLDDDDLIVWKVEALKGNMVTDDLDSSSNATNKPYMYGKTKSHKISTYSDSNWGNIAGKDANLGKYNEPFQTSNLIFNNAKYFSFEPDMSDEDHLPAVHHAGVKPGTEMTNIWRRNPHVAYKITAIINGTKEYTVTAKMDHKDVIRQEFINHITSVNSNISDIIITPERDELKSKADLGSTLRGDWGQAYYDYVFDKHLVLLSTKAKVALNSEPEHTFTVTGTTTTDTLSAGSVLSDKLRMNSAWRNPERNERITDNATSRHMVGRAVDLGASGVPFYGAGTPNRSKLLWQLWRAIDSTSSTDNGVEMRWMLEHGPSKTFYLQSGVVPSWSKVTQIFDNTDTRGAKETDAADGIPDIFNKSSHIHLETMPQIGRGN